MDTIENQKPKRKTKSIDRAVINEDTKIKLDGFKLQIAAQLGEFIKLSYTDLINLLVAVHADGLAPEEVEYIRQNKYDEGRFIKWAHQEYLATKERGESVTLEELIVRHKGLNPIATQKKSKRGRKRKAEQSAEFMSQPEVGDNKS